MKITELGGRLYSDELMNELRRGGPDFPGDITVKFEKGDRFWDSVSYPFSPQPRHVINFTEYKSKISNWNLARLARYGWPQLQGPIRLSTYATDILGSAKPEDIIHRLEHQQVEFSLLNDGRIIPVPEKDKPIVEDFPVHNSFSDILAAREAFSNLTPTLRIDPASDVRFEYRLHGGHSFYIAEMNIHIESTRNNVRVKDIYRNMLVARANR